MLVIFVFVAVIAGRYAAAKSAPNNPKRFTENFNLSSCSWSSTGRNDFFILEPGYQQVFEGREGNDGIRLEITVLDETRKLAGVETRVIEEKEMRHGVPIEISRNFFAVCRPTNDVFYFGEDVDMYKEGRVASHDGSWNADMAGAKPGLFMPARPLLGARFYQEVAPGIAMDRVEIASDSESLNTPAGHFHDVLLTEETTPLEPAMRDYKTYAKGVGLIRDGQLLIKKYGPLQANKQ
ncbi:MAG: hypothetical protein M3041_20520 [Acidobacteriota bacterium]|nr:hypothetical protein [Acidobacteriota bacterium]